MGLLSKLIGLFGSDTTSRDDRGTPVAVEREPDPASERAVKESVTEPAEPAETTDVEEVIEEAEATGEPVDTLSGIGPAYADRLGEAGIETVDDLAVADAAALDDATDIGEGRLAGWIEQARDR